MCNEVGQSAYTQSLFVVEITELAGFLKQIPSSALPGIKTVAVTGNLQDFLNLSDFGMLTGLETIKVMLSFVLNIWHPMSRRSSSRMQRGSQGGSSGNVQWMSRSSS